MHFIITSTFGSFWSLFIEHIFVPFNFQEYNTFIIVFAPKKNVYKILLRSSWGWLMAHFLHPSYVHVNQLANESIAHAAFVFELCYVCIIFFGYHTNTYLFIIGWGWGIVDGYLSIQCPRNVIYTFYFIFYANSCNYCLRKHNLRIPIEKLYIGQEFRNFQLKFINEVMWMNK